MADASLTVGVEVALSVDENTARWLESLGWVRPGAPSSEAVVTEPDDESDDWDPAEMMAVDVETLVPPSRPLRTAGAYKGRAMGGAEAMRYRAARLRQDLMNEVSSPERVDEMLRMCDVDPTALPDPDCDC
jgi:hypothetical protein